MTRPPKDFPQQKYVSAENTIRGTRTRGRATSFTKTAGAGKGFPCFYDQKPSFCSNGACSFHGFPSQFSRLIVNWILPAESAALLLPRRCRGCLPAGRGMAPPCSLVCSLVVNYLW